MIISIDNNTFEVGVIKVTRKASMLQESLGTTLDGTKHYNVYGTYYDYDVQFATKHMNVSDYDTLYDLVTSPVESHSVTLPYGQSTITFNAHVKMGNDALVHNFTALKKWGGFTVTFEALEPQREAE